MTTNKLEAISFKQIYDSLHDVSRASQLMNISPGKSSALFTENADIVSRFQGSVQLLSKDVKDKRGSYLVVDVDEEQYATLFEKLYYDNSMALSEQSVNVLHIAYGAVHWHDAQGVRYCSPLLLQPVQFEPKSFKDNYRIKALSSDIVLNSTLQYRLSQGDINVSLPDYVQGGDIVEYLRAVQQTVETQSWTVTESAYIGLFSFPKSIIFNDIKNNEEEVKRHPIIKALCGDSSGLNPLNIELSNGRIDDNIKSKDEHLVFDADSSQRVAIVAARNSKSFVLEGPPGTGKSQTISSLIADAIASNKSVLFVAQKEAALKVIERNLGRVGLSAYVLPMFTNQENRQRVINSLAESLEYDNVRLKGGVEERFDELDEAKQALNGYVDSLHGTTESGLTLFEILNYYIKYRKSPDAQYEFDNVQEITYKTSEKHIVILENFILKLKALGVDDYHKSVFYGLKPVTINIKKQEEIKNAYIDVQSALAEASEGYRNIKDDFNLGSLTAVSGLTRLPELVSEITTLAPFNESWFTEVRFNERLAKAVECAKNADIYHSCRDKLLSYFHEKLIDGNIILSKCFSAEGVGDVKAYKKEISANKKVLKKLVKAKVSLSATAVIEYTRLFFQLETARSYFSNNNQLLSALLGQDYVGIESDFETILKKLKVGDELITTFKDVYSAGFVRSICKGLSCDGELLERLNASVQASKNFKARLDKVQSYFEPSLIDFGTMQIEEVKHKIDNGISGIDKLIDYVGCIELLKEIDEAKLRGFVDSALGANVPPNDIVASYCRIYYRQLADYYKETSRWLKIFDGANHESVINRFVKLENERKIINVARIRERMTWRRPLTENTPITSEVGILTRQRISAKLPLAKLMASIKNLVPRIKPCLLMSPLAVSTYLPADMKFDLVIFDEASQITPADAIGAIYRGKQIVVVGDREQLPPTNFFKKMDEEGLTDDEQVYPLGKSILESLDGIIPAIRLQWHYRSLFEELIAVSNHYVYNDTLLTFTASKVAGKDEGIEYYYVDGIYTAGSGMRYNTVEVKKVVELVDECIMSHPERSLGIVTFNVGQRNKILTAVNKLLNKNRDKPEYKRFFEETSHEPLFVKNLENVQGDERDTVIFSVTYGPDENGNKYQNFGPISQEGGYKRLNVAISRAKVNMKVVSSLRPEDIVVHERKQKGVTMLRAFLNYAEKKTFEDDDTQTSTAVIARRSEIESEVYAELTKRGYLVERNIGCSSFKIDLAVKLPEDASNQNYIVGIMHDGYNYMQCHSAVDRDKLRGQILSARGWNIFNIWTTVFYINPSEEIRKIVEFIEASVRNRHKKKPAPKSTIQVYELEETVTDRRPKFEPYQKTGFDEVKAFLEGKKELGKGYWEDFASIASLIIRAEAPINHMEVARRMCKYVDKAEIFKEIDIKNLLDRYKEGLLARDIVLDESGYFLLPKQSKDGTYPLRTTSYKRPIKSICAAEFADGLNRMISCYVGIPLNQVGRDVARFCGYTDDDTLSEADMATIKEALNILIKNNKARVVGEFVYSM